MGTITMKTISTFALAAALIAGFSASSFAADAKGYSDVWKPGFTVADDDGRFYSDNRFATEGYNNGLKNVVKTIRSENAQSGFEANDNGFYERSISVKNNKNAKVELIDARDTWAPGYSRDDN